MLCFFFNDTAPTEIYTLSLHDALPIFRAAAGLDRQQRGDLDLGRVEEQAVRRLRPEHQFGQGQDRKSTPSELQSRQYLVCRLLLEKKKLYITKSPFALTNLIVTSHLSL